MIESTLLPLLERARHLQAAGRPVARRIRMGGALCHSGSVTYDPGRRGGGRVPVLRNEWREPLRAQRDPVADDSGRTRSNRDDRQQWRKQTWLGRFVSTYGWRAYALPVLVALTAVVVYQTVTGTGASRPADAAGPDPGAADHRPGQHRDHRRAAEGDDAVRRQSADRHPARRRALHRGGRQDVAHRARRDSEGGRGHDQVVHLHRRGGGRRRHHLGRRGRGVRADGQRDARQPEELDPQSAVRVHPDRRAGSRTSGCR